ncbi:MAG: hypothetical protein V7K21_27780 [Nostoc sp.]|uniref:hypothetical protein n=1 Tax=Nostoc sp. TaxID=1180 RepID=UPI002FF5970E
MKSKAPSNIQAQSQVKPMKAKRTTLKEPSWKKFPKPIINASVIGSVICLTIYFSALGVLVISNCAELRVQLHPFELQLIKGSCNRPPDQ